MKKRADFGLFRKTVWDFYEKSGRHNLPWRKTRDPYAILVSEIMLQQTQAPRVVPKFESWMEKFPTVEALASAAQTDVLREWKGLGYNRRALNFKRAAETIVQKFDGKIPRDEKSLVSLPGIGPYTAAAVQAFAFNIPSVVIETNIRTVFIKHFFENRRDKKVTDKELLPLIEQTLDKENPREWYAALMDYGAHIKKTEGNFSKRAKTFTTQSRFKGSNRENRSKILELLFEKPRTKQAILKLLVDERTEKNLNALLSEGFIRKSGRTISLA